MYSIFNTDIDEEDDEDMMGYDCQREVLLFFKYYDPVRRTTFYMGHSIEHIMSKFCEFICSLCKAKVREGRREGEGGRGRERDGVKEKRRQGYSRSS